MPGDRVHTFAPKERPAAVPAVLTLAIGAVLVVSACNRDGPNIPSLSLALTQETLALARQDVVQLSAVATSSVSGTSDVTVAAQWQTSNTAVATVSGGAVTGVGPGTATITAVYEDESKTATVTVRRRTALRGALRVSDAGGDDTLANLLLQVEGRTAGFHSSSTGQPTATIQIGSTTSSRERTLVAPGDRRVTLVVEAAQNSEYELVWQGPLQIIDYDTGDVLGTVVMESRELGLESGDDVSWTVTVSAITS